MSMINAFRFLGACRVDPDFRQTLYRCEDPTAFRECVRLSGYDFTEPEFDDALRSLELRAVDEEDASGIKELGQWYKMQADAGPVSPCASCHGARARGR